MAAKSLKLDHDELFENPHPRVPVCLVLDVSPSMKNPHRDGEVPIEALNTGVAHFFHSVRDDDMAHAAADIAIVTFAEDATIAQDFGPVDRMPPLLATRGTSTSLGRGVELGLDLLDRRKAQFGVVGLDCYQPWMVIMTDGQPMDLTHLAVAQRVSELVRSCKLTVFPIGIGSEADMNVLAMFSPKRPPLRLKGLQFSRFFEWLSNSIAATSRSMPDQNFDPDIEEFVPWADVGL